MRTLIIGALAVTMAGCCSRLPPRATAASDADGVTSFETVAARPVEPVPVAFKPRSAIEKIHARIAAKSKRPSLARSSKTPAPHAHDGAADSRSTHARVCGFAFGRHGFGRCRREPKDPHDPTTGRGRDGSRRTHGGSRHCSTAQRARLPNSPGDGASGYQVDRRSHRANRCDRRAAGRIPEQGLDRDGRRRSGAGAVERERVRSRSTG